MKNHFPETSNMLHVSGSIVFKNHFYTMHLSKIFPPTHKTSEKHMKMHKFAEKYRKTWKSAKNAKKI